MECMENEEKSGKCMGERREPATGREGRVVKEVINKINVYVGSETSN